MRVDLPGREPIACRTRRSKYGSRTHHDAKRTEVASIDTQEPQRTRRRWPWVVGILAVAVAAIVGAQQAGTHRIGNGNSGLYVRPADAQQNATSELVTNPVSSGMYTTFEQSVYVCTSECNTALETVGILELDAPIEGTLTLMFHDFSTLTSTERMVALAEAVIIEG